MARVTVWNEHRIEQQNEEAAATYPNGIHTTIAEFVGDAGHRTRTATLDEPEHGLTESALAETDVLIWWDHVARDEVSDEVAQRVVDHVLDGMGLIVLHSAHGSKVFTDLMGTSCDLKWREAAETERLWVVEPGHPIAEGIDECVEIPESEMYGAPHDVPAPDTLVFIGWFEGGEVFRSGCCYRRGEGDVFYFQPGHETYPVLHQPEIQRILVNAVEWAAPTQGADVTYGNYEPSEPIE